MTNHEKLPSKQRVNKNQLNHFHWALNKTVLLFTINILFTDNICEIKCFF